MTPGSLRVAALILALCSIRLAAQNVGFIVDNSLGEVKVLDLGQRRVVAAIPTGAESTEMLILPNNQIAFVPNQAENNVAVLDLESRTRLTTLPAGESPGALINSPDGRFVYVVNEGSNDVTVIDAVARSVLATVPVDATPVAINVSPNGRFLYVVNRDAEPTGTVSVMDTNRLQIVQALAVGLQPIQFAIAPDLRTAYVVNSGSDSVSVVDLERNEITAEIPVGRGPAGVTFSTDGRLLYAINRNSNNISVVDTARNAVIGQIPVGAQPADMVVTFDSRYGFVSNLGSNNVTLLDLAARTAELTIATGAQPFDVALDPNEDFLYVTNLGSQSLTVIDVNTDRAVATIPLGGIPIQFTQFNSPTLLELAPNPAPSASRLVLNGESLLPGAVVRFTTIAPPRTFTVPPTWLDSQGLEVTIPSFQGSSAVVTVAHADGNSSEQLTLRVGTAAPAIFSGGVVESAGLQLAPYPITGAGIASVFGGFPGAATEEAASFPLPATLGNSRVTFNGAPAPLLFSSSGQINVVAPVRLLSQSSVRVAVSVQNQTSRVETVNVAAAAPGVFQPATAGASAFFHGSRLTSRVTTTDPAQRGEILAGFLTGLGNTNPPPLDGQAAPGDVLSHTVEPPAVTVGGAPARVLFSGLAPGFSGLYQINFEVPAAAPTGDQVSVAVSAGGRTSNTVRVAVR